MPLLLLSAVPSVAPPLPPAGGRGWSRRDRGYSRRGSRPLAGRCIIILHYTILYSGRQMRPLPRVRVRHSPATLCIPGNRFILQISAGEFHRGARSPWICSLAAAHFFAWCRSFAVWKFDCVMSIETGLIPQSQRRNLACTEHRRCDEDSVCLSLRRRCDRDSVCLFVCTRVRGCPLRSVLACTPLAGTRGVAPDHALRHHYPTRITPPACTPGVVPVANLSPSLGADYFFVARGGHWCLRRRRPSNHLITPFLLTPPSFNIVFVPYSCSRSLPSAPQALIIPSLLAADAGAYATAARDAEAAGAAWLHVDVYDGSPVAAGAYSSMGPATVRPTHPPTNKPANHPTTHPPNRPATNQPAAHPRTRQPQYCWRHVAARGRARRLANGCLSLFQHGAPTVPGPVVLSINCTGRGCTWTFTSTIWANTCTHRG